jgi:hypothetical protein
MLFKSDTGGLRQCLEQGAALFSLSQAYLHSHSLDIAG